MSAWIPAKQHINAMVWMRYKDEALGLSSIAREQDVRNAFGQILTDEVVKSVQYRYQDSEWNTAQADLPGWADWTLKPYVYVEPVLKPSEGEQFAILRCYRYQACEHPEYDDSDSGQFVETELALLPDYDLRGLPWGWEHD